MLKKSQDSKEDWAIKYTIKHKNILIHIRHYTKIRNITVKELSFFFNSHTSQDQIILNIRS